MDGVMHFVAIKLCYNTKINTILRKESTIFIKLHLTNFKIVKYVIYLPKKVVFGIVN